MDSTRRVSEERKGMGHGKVRGGYGTWGEGGGWEGIGGGGQREGRKERNE